MIFRKTSRLEKINASIQACSNCELCNLECNKKDVSKGFGKLYGWRGSMRKCCFLFVGMNPSYNRFAGHEYAFGGINGSPGPGEKFNQLLKETDVFEQMFIDNLIHCSSSSNTIRKTWAKACFPHLVDEINVLKPKIVIAMGRQVFEFLNDSFITNNIRLPLKSIYHPSYVFSYHKVSRNEYKNAILETCYGCSSNS